MTEPVRILIVDDDPASREIAGAILAQGDFQAIVAVGSARDAYDILRLDDDDPDVEPAFDVVLLDIVMPLVDGVEACAAIRGTRRYRNVPILMVSGRNDAEVLNQAFIAGANDYIAKPIKPIELLTRVRSSLRFKREIDRRLAREAQLQARALSQQPAAAATIDPQTGLHPRALLEAQIGAAADDEARAALMLITLDRIVSYQRENGEAQADRLMWRVARELSALPAPLCALLGEFGEGGFMILAPGAGADQLDGLAQAARARMEQLALFHGGSTDNDNVCLTMVLAEAQGEPLRGLPARMIARSEEAARAGGNQVIRMMAA